MFGEIMNAMPRGKPNNGRKQRVRETEGIGVHFNQIIKDPLIADIPNSLKKTMRGVNDDVNDMIEWRKPAVKEAEDAIAGYMAFAMPTKPGRSTFFPPVLHAITWSAMSIKAAHMPRVEYKHKLSRSEPIMKFLNSARDNAEAGDGDMRPPSLFNWSLQSFDETLFGVGFRHLTYMVQKRRIHIKNDAGRWVERNVVVYDDIWDEHLNFFHTGVSRDTLPGMFGGTSGYNDKFFRREMFARYFKDNPLYMNIELALQRYKGPFIRVRRYWNLALDLYFVQAMDADDDLAEDPSEGIPIREDYILEYGPEHRPRKMIPITSIHGEFNFDMRTSDTPNFLQDGRQYSDILGPSNRPTFWTKGRGQIAKGCIGIKRAMHRATHDNMKASTVFFAMSQNPGVLNQIKRSDMYGVVPLKADDRSFSVKALLERNEAFSGIVEYDEAIDNIASAALGDDWRQSAAQLTNEKATVAAIRENIKRVRAKQMQGMNEAGGMNRHYLLQANLIQQFYPEKTQIDLLPGETVPENVEEPDIVRDLDGSVIGYKRAKKITFKEPVVVQTKDGRLSVRVDEIEGDRELEVSKDMIVSTEEPEVHIMPGSTFAEMEAIERSLDLERLDHYRPFLELAYPGEDGQMQPLISREGAEHLLRESAETWNDDPDKILGKRKDGPERPKLKRAFSGKPPTAPTPQVTPPVQSGGMGGPVGSARDAMNGQGGPLARMLTPGA